MDYLDEMRVKSLAIEFSRALEEIEQEKIDKFNDEVEKVNVVCGVNLKERLENMREDLGFDMFDKIAAGGSLMPTLDKWTAEKIQNAVETLSKQTVEFFKENGNEDITAEHVMAFVQFASSLM